MAVDVVKHLLRTFSAAGVVLPEGTFKSMRVAFQRYAEDAVADSFAVARFNGLAHDRHAEEEAVHTFAVALAEGCEQFSIDPLGTPSLPNWARVLSAIPDAGERLIAAVSGLGWGARTMRIAAVLTDLDGTLLEPDGTAHRGGGRGAGVARGDRGCR